MMDQPRAHGNAVQRLCRLAARYVRQRTDDGQTSAHAGQGPRDLDGYQWHPSRNGHPAPARRKKLNMQADLTTRILSNPDYQALKAKRSRFGWWLTLAMMVVYYGFILLVAFDKPFLATRLGAGVTTIGMPIGLGVIIFTVIITAIYVRRANSEYDALTERIAKAALI
jgi:uncharacterized membrane protein (DUF485 family)